jgi:hypothetical protein
MMGDYGEVFAAFKGRGRALPASNWSISKTFSSGSISGFHGNFSRHRRSELDCCRLLPEYSQLIRFSTMMDGHREVFAAFEGRGRALPASNWSISKTFSSGSNSGFWSIIDAKPHILIRRENNLALLSLLVLYYSQLSTTLCSIWRDEAASFLW